MSTRRTTRPSGRQLLTGLLIIELDDVRWSRGLEKWLEDWQPAGVILGGSYLRTPELTAEFLARAARALSAPPILALREGGGSLGPLRNFFPRIPSPRAVARQGPRAARKLGELMGSALRLIGFNTMFAPSLDLSAPYSDNLLHNHIFSSHPEIVTRCGGEFIHGLQRHGILSAPGHFPGISDAKLDSISKLHTASKSMADMWREDLIPFRRLLRHSPFVVISHLPYKAYDFDLARPASMSRSVLQGLLRNKLGYRGVTVAGFWHATKLLSEASSPDTSEDGSVTVLLFSAYSESIAAGCDLQVAFPGEKNAQHVLRSLQQAGELGTLPRARIEEATKRVRTAKKVLRRPSGKLNRKSFNKLAREFEDFARSCTE
jgi:beta-N-acetylhexosaminidase